MPGDLVTIDQPSTQTNNIYKKFPTLEHSACGVYMRVNVPHYDTATQQFVVNFSHSVVEEGLEALRKLAYRSGYNDITGESDGAGIKLYGLPTAFFNKKITEGHFKTPQGDVLRDPSLQENQYAVGQYFLPKEPIELKKAKLIIQNNALANGLVVVGWRNLNADEAVNDEILSGNALEKKPAIWQAILQSNQTDLDAAPIDLESAALKAAIATYYDARQNQVAMNILSQSAESIVYKGMVRPEEIGVFFKDLNDQDFTASSTAVHARFATNTDPQWANAQPCVFFWSHNGELNSAPANAAEMREELNSLNFKGVYPNGKLSDSMQFDADLANLMTIKNISLLEALVRLMPPTPCEETYSAEDNAMLKSFMRERTPYNGPAFAVAAHRGYFIAKLDSVGLRPSRWKIVEDASGYRQFYAASDDFHVEGKVIQKGHLEPGGMIVVTPDGQILKTSELLAQISAEYHAKSHDPDYFQNQMKSTLAPLIASRDSEPSPVEFISDDERINDGSESLPTLLTESVELNRILYGAGWDHESVRQSLRHMAEFGYERVGAMGDDTNPLHTTTVPPHIAYFFHQLFAQVSAPPLDSVNEPAETFSLKTYLGPVVIGSTIHGKQVPLESPILGITQLDAIERNPEANAHVLNICFDDNAEGISDPAELMRKAIQKLLIAAEQAAEKGGILVLSDRNSSPKNLAIPDVIAVAAVRRHLESKNLIRNVSIVADSFQTNGPHHASVLLALGAKAVYTRGAYAKIKDLYDTKSTYYADNYHKAMDKCLLKTMGKMGITDVDNYINGGFVAALGIDLSNESNSTIATDPCLANIFPNIYSPLRGLNFTHIAKSVQIRHDQAHDENNQFIVLPHSGYYMPEKEGIKHGYGPVVINAFTEWLKEEEVNATLVRLHDLLEQNGYPNFIQDSTLYTPEAGFIDWKRKDAAGYYLPDETNTYTICNLGNTSTFDKNKLYVEFFANTISYTLKTAENTFISGVFNTQVLEDSNLTPPLNVDKLQPHVATIMQHIAARGIASITRFGASAAFKKMEKTIDEYRVKNPTSIRDHFVVRKMASQAELRKFLNLPQTSTYDAQTQADLRKLLYAGSMSQGALTVAADADNPNKLGAHETLTRGMNAAGAMSASGEGGEAAGHLRDHFMTTRSKQIASGRFGVSAMQIECAEEIEIKVAQGAKPGEGGQLSGLKVSIRFAAQRGGLPGTNFISPPPHHDIYSIEDLEQLIRDVKSVKPNINVSVKLVASQGIGTIAVGVAKAGADVINVAGNSGGTGAAQQSSIKHAGLPAELGLAEVDRALRKTKLRDFVKLRVSGGFKTAEDVILAAILGADLYEFGTTSMLTLGCKMQRTCDRSCQPGVAMDGHLFKGDQLNTERYFMNLAASIQERLHALGVNSLEEIKGRTELLDLINLDPAIKNLYDFSPILDRQGLPPRLTVAQLNKAKQRRQLSLKRDKEDALVQEIKAFFEKYPDGEFNSSRIAITTQDRTFGSRVAGTFVRYLEAHPAAKINLNTSGEGGQSFGFVLPRGMRLSHYGSVQDGCGKSQTGGVISVLTPDLRGDYRADENTIAGNALFYGASGGKAFINGVVGHRFAILCKGAQIVVEGTGDLAFEYMTSGTGLILGKTGKSLCTSATGGIVFVYNKDQKLKHAKSVRAANAAESKAYESVIINMLQEHLYHTNSLKAREILNSFNLSDFKVLIPTALDHVQTLAGIIDVIKTYQLREAPITDGMRVWLEVRTREIVEREIVNPAACDQLIQLRQLLESTAKQVMSLEATNALTKMLSGVNPPPKASAIDDIESLFSVPVPASAVSTKFKIRYEEEEDDEAIKKRLKKLGDSSDDIFQHAITNIALYVSQLTEEATGCSGCRAQSCAGGDDVETGCPSGKQINRLNLTLQKIGPIAKDGILSKQQWKMLREAFEIQIKESPFIAYTGAACPAPCQDACTETIPERGQALKQRGGKPVGEHVHIKHIEYHMYQIGRTLGWFNGKKVWTDDELSKFFTADKESSYQAYQEVLKKFKPPFRAPEKKQFGKKLILVGSGPAAMQMAFEALHDGLAVEMYEKSDKAGGLLVDGIPPDKFSKQYVAENFADLKDMGLKVKENSEVYYDKTKQGFYVVGDTTGTMIAAGNDENNATHVALCVGAGKPRELDAKVTGTLPENQKNIIQAVDFLKATNDITAELARDPTQDKEKLIKAKLGHMDPRGKKIVVIGGGLTSEDVTHWVAHYFTQAAASGDLTSPLPPVESESATSLERRCASVGELTVLARAPQQTVRGILDGYPAPSKAVSLENLQHSAEIHYVNGDALHSVAPTKIEIDPNHTNKVNVHIAESTFTHQQIINNKDHKDHKKMKALLDGIPREKRPCSQPVNRPPVKGVDLVICALGFSGGKTIAIVEDTKGLNNVSLAGDVIPRDVPNVKPQIIVGAQASGHDTYQNRIKPAMNIRNEDSAPLKPANRLSDLTSNTMFRKPRSSRRAISGAEKENPNASPQPLMSY